MILVNSFPNAMNLCMIICKPNTQCVMIKKRKDLKCYQHVIQTESFHMHVLRSKVSIRLKIKRNICGTCITSTVSHILSTKSIWQYRRKVPFWCHNIDMTSWRYQISQNSCFGAKVLWIIYNCFLLECKACSINNFYSNVTSYVKQYV